MYYDEILILYDFLWFNGWLYVCICIDMDKESMGVGIWCNEFICFF